jgi:hypothetical protein
MGKAGGRASATSRNGLNDDVADAKLIGLGKRRLEQLVNSDNEQVALRAATALYSYRAQSPPASEAPTTPERPGYGDTTVADIFRVLVFEAHGAFDEDMKRLVVEAYWTIADEERERFTAETRPGQPTAEMATRP